jgi:hypothetical protein
MLVQQPKQVPRHEPTPATAPFFCTPAPVNSITTTSTQTSTPASTTAAVHFHIPLDDKSPHSLYSPYNIYYIPSLIDCSNPLRDDCHPANPFLDIHTSGAAPYFIRNDESTTKLAAGVRAAYTAGTSSHPPYLGRRSLTSPNLHINTDNAISFASMSFAATDDAQAATPGSPPDLTGSKSSKSSSYHSSYHSEEDSILADINHFEDIGLDDEAVRSELEIGDFDLKSPTPYLSNFNASELRSAKRRMPPSLKKTHTAISHRELTGSGTRPAYPRLRSPIGGVVADTFPNGLAPGLLIPRGHNPRSPHGFPPHDHRSRSLSPNTLVHPHRLPSPTSRSSSAAGPSIPRRGSWQSQTRSRKTQADLEREFDEEDGDDVPDNYLLENVPISPRPPEERSQPPSPARSPDRHPHPHAPEKTKEKRVKTAGNGTPPHKVEHGDLKSPTNGGMPKPPIRGMSMGQFPIHRPGDEHRYQMKGRAKSWTVVLSELSAEARALTEKLEEHADETESFSQNNSARNSAGSTSSSSSAGSGGKPPQAHSRMNTRSASTPHLPSTIPLPPLTRPSHNVLLDPLPPSKEKSAVLSRTRPSWLPPKNPSEEKRHLKEYARMMAASLESERKRREQKEGRRRAYKAEEEERERRWEEDVLPNWKEGTMLDWHRDKGVRELWWRGIPARVRGRVWARAVGNELSLSEGSFRAALERGRVVERMLDSQEGGGKGMGLRNGEEKRRMEWIRCIRRDVAETFKELGLFQPGGRLERELRDVLVAYAMYRSDVGYVRGMNVRILFPSPSPAPLPDLPLPPFLPKALTSPP